MSSPKAIITRKDAIAQGLVRYFTGKPCKFLHVAERYLSTANCAQCHREHYKPYKAEYNRRYRLKQKAEREQGE